MRQVRNWTRDEDDGLLYIKGKLNKPWRIVAAYVGRTRASCRSRYAALLRTPEQRRARIDRQAIRERQIRISRKRADSDRVDPIIIPPFVLVERDRRQRAEDMRLPPATLMGDPAPGFSALDLMRAR